MSENLAAIQAKFSNEINANIFAKDAAPLICKRRFVDTVRAHLSQVQLALSLKLVCNFTVPEENTYMEKTHQVLIEVLMCIKELTYPEQTKGLVRFNCLENFRLLHYLCFCLHREPSKCHV